MDSNLLMAKESSQKTDCPEWRSVKGLLSIKLPHRQEDTYELEDTALAVKYRTRTAYNTNFDNRHMKPPIFAKKTEKWLNGPPFLTVPNNPVVGLSNG